MDIRKKLFPRYVFVESDNPKELYPKLQLMHMEIFKSYREC